MLKSLRWKTTHKKRREENCWVFRFLKHDNRGRGDRERERELSKELNTNNQLISTNDRDAFNAIRVLEHASIVRTYTSAISKAVPIKQEGSSGTAKGSAMIRLPGGGLPLESGDVQSPSGSGWSSDTALTEKYSSVGSWHPQCRQALAARMLRWERLSVPCCRTPSQVHRCVPWRRWPRWPTRAERVVRVSPPRVLQAAAASHAASARLLCHRLLLSCRSTWDITRRSAVRIHTKKKVFTISKCTRWKFKTLYVHSIETNKKTH